LTGEHTTVTKCPSCGKVSVGMPPSCPGCQHIFAEPDANLPAVREQTIEFQTRSALERTREGATRGMPRHIVVPVVAGLLVAIVVLILVRLNASDGRNSGAATGNIPTREGTGLAATPGTHQDGLGESGEPSRRDGVVPRLGPGASKISPSEIRLGSLEPADDARELVLMDGSMDTCYFLEKSAEQRRLTVTFPSSMRFSHVLFHVSCLRSTRKGLRGQITLRTDGGTARRVQIPGVSGPTYVDLAGAWTRRIEIELTASEFEEIGLGELEFFAFEDEELR
jgi:hypothetical protein